MKTQFLLVASLVSVGLIVSGDSSRPALAQQDTRSLLPSHVVWVAEHVDFGRQGGVPLTTLQGDVKLKSFGEMPVSIRSEGGFLVFIIPNETPATLRVTSALWSDREPKPKHDMPPTVRVPMDAATMKVTVTALGTVFEDAKNDKVTVTLDPMP